MQYKCEECGEEFKTLQGLSSHNRQKHGISTEETYIKYVLNGVRPTCECGCGGDVKFLTINKGFNKFIRGHSSRVNNNWGHNPEAKKKSKETMRKKYESGELTVWNKGLTIEDERVKSYVDKMKSHPTRGEKISKSLKGRERPKEVLEKLHEGMVNYWSKDENREKQSDTRIRHIKENGFIPISELEIRFSNMLDECGIEYYEQFYVRDIKSLYDFKIKGKNILIEVDGDFWHCNPNTKHKEPSTEHQKQNLIKDKVKNDWCEGNGYTLLRFWESDINERTEWVISELKKVIK